MSRVLRVRYIIKDTYLLREKLHDFIDFIVDETARTINFIGNFHIFLCLVIFRYIMHKSVCLGAKKDSDYTTYYYIIGDNVFDMDIPEWISEAICFQRIKGKEYRVYYRLGGIREAYVREGKQWKKMIT